MSTESREDASHALSQLARLSVLTEALAKARTPEELATIVVENGERALAAHVSSFVRFDGVELVRLAIRGVSEEYAKAYERFSLELDGPSSIAVRNGAPLWIESREAYRAMIALPPPLEAAEAACAIPLVVDERCIGAIVFLFAEPRTFSATERVFMETFARQAAIALERTESHARELEYHRRLEALASLAEGLTSALTREDVVSAIVDRGRQAARADTAAIYELAEDGMLRLVASRGVAPEIAAIVAESPPDAANAAHRLALAGKSVWIEDDETYARYFPQLAALPADVPRAHSLWTVPLAAEGRVFGILGMGFFTPRTFPPAEREFVATFAHYSSEAYLRAKRLEAERHARREADLANRAKDEFLATVSHELRTPLNAIMGWARMLSTMELEPDKVVRAIETIDRNAVAMAQLIEDLLDISRIISGKMRLDVQSVALAPSIEAAIESIRPAADAKDIRLYTTFDDTAGPLMGDPTRLQQIFWNLFSNAVKFTPKGGEIDVLMKRVDAGLQVVVRDSGKGIAPDFLAYVFEPFRQEDASHTRAHGGLGLGLAITRQLVELHGGHIEVRSEGANRGATFVVTLPISARATRA